MIASGKNLVYAVSHRPLVAVLHDQIAMEEAKGLLVRLAKPLPSSPASIELSRWINSVRLLSSQQLLPCAWSTILPVCGAVILAHRWSWGNRTVRAAIPRTVVLLETGGIAIGT